MTLSVGDRPLSSPDDLSEPGRLCLGLIDGGAPWAAWAASQPNARYAFADETALVEGVQHGLHGAPLTLLPGLGLAVGPARLMALEAAQLKTLAKAEAAGKATPSVGKLLAEANLLTAAQLAAGVAWLAEQGVADAPVFQASSFADRIALADLAAGDTAEAALGKEASAFAVLEARTPAEFGDYRRLYLALAGRPGPTDAAGRQALARSCLDILLPWMFTALDCPSLPLTVTLDAAIAAMGDWLISGRLLGFVNAAGGARQICERTDFTPDTEDVGALIAGYLGKASAAIAAGPVSGTLNQDGQSARLRAGGAAIALSATGELSLDDFQPAPEPV